MKKVELLSGFLPKGKIKYNGEYIYKVKGYREGAHGLGEGYPQPEFFDIDVEGAASINGKMEKTIAITINTPLDCRMHHYYLLEHDVWVKNLGDLRYVSDWTNQEVWALAVQNTYSADGTLTGSRELGFAIIHSDRNAGYVL